MDSVRGKNGVVFPSRYNMGLPDAYWATRVNKKNPSNSCLTDFFNISGGLPNELKNDVAWDASSVHLFDVSSESLADACVFSSI